MKLVWQIAPEDVERVKQFVDSYRGTVLVRRRESRNLSDDLPFPSREETWEAIVACLLTTQQKSGPQSAVTSFMLKKPFPLSLDVCSSKWLVESAAQTLVSHGKLRRVNMIATELAANFDYLSSNGWVSLEQNLRAAHSGRTRDAERTAARFISQNLRGFGPKQSRNLLQKLGISRYEIPIDSRITKWLNANGCLYSCRQPPSPIQATTN